MSGPTFIPEPGDNDADRRAWEDEQVPYDDATIAAYEEEDMPPFDMPFEEMPVATPTRARGIRSGPGSLAHTADARCGTSSGVGGSTD